MIVFRNLEDVFVHTGTNEAIISQFNSLLFCNDDYNGGDDDDDDNSIQFFINVPRQQPQGQLQTQHSVNKVITI
jgi:hypothetical protein